MPSDRIVMQLIRVPLLLALLAAVPLADAEWLFVFHGDRGEAAVFEGPALRPLGGAAAPHGAFAAFRAGERTYLVGTERVGILGEGLQTVGAIDLPEAPATAAAYDAFSGHLLVAADESLYRIDTQSDRIASTLDVGGQATALHLPADGRRLYWLTAGSRQARVIDLATNRALPGAVDLPVTPDAFAGGFLSAGAEVFPASVFEGGIGGAVSTSRDSEVLLAASPSGSKLLRSHKALLYAPADSPQPIELADPATRDPLPPASTQAILSADGKTAYAALADGRVLSLDPSGARKSASAWTASAPTGLALAVEPSPAQGISLTKVSGDQQFAVSGANFNLVVNGPIGGIPMTVTPSSAAAQCDSVPPLSGDTAIGCTANNVAVVTTVMLTVSALDATTTFTVYIVPPGLPDGLFAISGNNQTVNAGASFALVVEARQGGVPIPSRALTVSDDSASVTCPASGITTNSAGRATITCTVAGSVATSHTATITVSDTLPTPNTVQFTATIIGDTGVNDALVRITPDPVTVFESTSFNLTVEARSGGAPQASVPLTVAVSNTVVLCPPTAVTGTNGRATLACGAGAVTADLAVQVTISDGSRSVTYSVTVKEGTPVEGIRKVSGDNQVVLPNTAFPQPLVVRAVSGGQLQEGLLLAVTVSSSIVTCSTSTLTDANGLASITCIANSVAGPTQVNIQVSDAVSRMLPQPFVATVAPDSGGSPAERITVLSGASISARVGDTLPFAIQARTETNAGAIVGGATVYARGPQGVTLTPASIQSNASGIATFDVSFGCAPPAGQIQLGLAAASTEATIDYTLAQGPFSQLRKVQGDAQSGVPGQPLPLALVIESADQCGAVIGGVPVAWSVNPPEAAMLEGVVAVTNGQGRASARVRPSARGGAYEVRVVASQNTNIGATFALATANAPTQLLIVSGNQQSVPANMAAPSPLVVRVASAGGQPVQGVQVSFQVISGSGTIGSTSAVTNAQGQTSTAFTAGPLRGPATVRATAVGFTVDFGLTVGGGTPQLQVPGFVNGASFRSGFVSGSTGTIFGVNITDGESGVFPTPYDPLNGFPTLFRGLRVTVGGIPAPILSLANVNGQEQVNIQVPFGLAQGTVTVVVENQGTQATISGIPVFSVQPGVFEFALGGQLYAAVLHADFSVVTPENPARPGEVLLLFITGLGALTPPVATNQAGPVSPLSTTVAQPTVTLNGVEQTVEGSFYAPQLLTVYQINFRVKADTAPGSLALVVAAQGTESQSTTLPVAAAF